MIGRRAAVVAATLLVTACNGGGGGTDAYFEAIVEVTEAYVTDVSGLPIASTDGTVEDARAFFVGIDAALDRALAGLAEVTVPAEVDQVHARFVESLAAFALVADEAAAYSRQLVTAGDLIELANHPEAGVARFSAAREVVAATCRDLQDAAERRVDLRCEAFTRSEE